MALEVGVHFFKGHSWFKKDVSHFGGSNRTIFLLEFQAHYVHLYSNCDSARGASSILLLLTDRISLSLFICRYVESKGDRQTDMRQTVTLLI